MPESYDCFGLAVEVLARLGLAIDYELAGKWIRRYIPGQVDPELVLEYECEADEEPHAPGDLLVMRSPDSPNPRATHIAVHIGKNMVIQSTKGVGVHLVPYRVVEPMTIEVISWQK